MTQTGTDATNTTSLFDHTTPKERTMIDSTAPDIRRALQRARRYTTACWDANEGNLDADALVRLAARLDAEAHGEGSTLSADLVLSRQWNAEFDARAANTR